MSRRRCCCCSSCCCSHCCDCPPGLRPPGLHLLPGPPLHTLPSAPPRPVPGPRADLSRQSSADRSRQGSWLPQVTGVEEPGAHPEGALRMLPGLRMPGALPTFAPILPPCKGQLQCHV